MKRYQSKETVELFHLLFLSFFGKKTDQQLYALKGGCNLRFFFNSPRYSEDMDLDIHGIPVYTLQEKVNTLLNSRPFRQTLSTNHIEIEHITEHKQSETTQRWKLGLLAPHSDQPIPTKIEFSRRGLDSPSLFERINPSLVRHYRLTPFMSTHYPAEVACRQKIGALASRSVTQARDIFDLHLLLSEHGMQKLIAQLNPEIRDAAERNVTALTFDHFKGQVLAYLAPEDQLLYDSPDLWEKMQMDLLEELETPQ
jgi:predicted nucleotidyltransferase component of viral defense system